MSITTRFAFRVRDLHREGVADSDIAERLGVSRDEVSEGHRRIDLIGERRSGMDDAKTLRDEFAIAAIQAMTLDPAAITQTTDAIVDLAFRVADAAMKRRQMGAGDAPPPSYESISALSRNEVRKTETSRS